SAPTRPSKDPAKPKHPLVCKNEARSDLRCEQGDQQRPSPFERRQIQKGREKKRGDEKKRNQILESRLSTKRVELLAAQPIKKNCGRRDDDEKKEGGGVVAKLRRALNGHPPDRHRRGGREVAQQQRQREKNTDRKKERRNPAKPLDSVLTPHARSRAATS